MPLTSSLPGEKGGTEKGGGGLRKRKNRYVGGGVRAQKKVVAEKKENLTGNGKDEKRKTRSLPRIARGKKLPQEKKKRGW